MVEDGWIVRGGRLVVGDQAPALQPALHSLMAVCGGLLGPPCQPAGSLAVLSDPMEARAGHIRLWWVDAASFELQAVVNGTRKATSVLCAPHTDIFGSGGEQLSKLGCSAKVFQGAPPPGKCVVLANPPVAPQEWRQPQLPPDSLQAFAKASHDAVLGSGEALLPMYILNGDTHGLLPGTWLWVNAQVVNVRGQLPLEPADGVPREDTWWTALVVGRGKQEVVLLLARPGGILELRDQAAATRVPVTVITVSGWQSGAMVPAMQQSVDGSPWKPDLTMDAAVRRRKRARHE